MKNTNKHPSASSKSPDPGLVSPDLALQFPSREPTFDVLPGFQTPPRGYGAVSFYWWLGDPLLKERLLWQLDQLKDTGISGLQINYAHSDEGGSSYGLTLVSEPPLFSEQWWELFDWFLKEANQRGMSVSFSDYTLSTPGQGWYSDAILREHPDMGGANLAHTVQLVSRSANFNCKLPQNTLSVMAYRLTHDHIEPESGLNLHPFVEEQVLNWNVPADGVWQIVTVYYIVKPNSLDPMHPELGSKVIEKFFQPFEDRNPHEAGRGLNFFFSDELNFGISGNLWNKRFAQEFLRRKNYNILTELPALFVDTGPITPKIRLDYRDVLVELQEEGYFRPVFNWHQTRNMIYGCDHGGRGKDVLEFGDYFRTQRWNQGPGNDQPDLQTDIIKNKVASSIAHLYERPRTWLEGFYASGWATTTTQLTQAIFQNFVAGHNLFSLHGLYYSTHGSWWEWAPPCNHFRMPYWKHLSELLRCSERLSYLLSQGVHCCDVSLVYPVAAMEAGVEGEAAVEVAFRSGEVLFKQGIDFDFIDFQSLERAQIDNRTLKVAGETYRVLILPAMRVVRHSTIQKALEFYRAGGMVVALHLLPEASERTGYGDDQLNQMVQEIFGDLSQIPASSSSIIFNRNQNGGWGVLLGDLAQLEEVITKAVPRDFYCVTPPNTAIAQVLHRKIGPLDIYAVYGVPKNTNCFFRATGQVQLWNPWTGQVGLIANVSTNQAGTFVTMPLESVELQLIVFEPTAPTAITKDLNQTVITSEQESVLEVLTGKWSFELKPTLVNQWGDFRLPAFNGLIGAEARQFRYAPTDKVALNWQDPQFDDSNWSLCTCSYGPRFWKLGPLPLDLDTEALEKALTALSWIEPTVPVDIDGKNYYWQLYEYSLRSGVEGDPGHQGWHGLKGKVSDDFIVLGKKVTAQPLLMDTRYELEETGSRYYLWTGVFQKIAGTARVLAGDLRPVRFWIDASPKDSDAQAVQLKQGYNRLLLRYDQPGRTHFMLEAGSKPPDWSQNYPLAMIWYNQPDLLEYDVKPQTEYPYGFYRFTAPPGLEAMIITVHGKVKAWVNGLKVSCELLSHAQDSITMVKATLIQPATECVIVALLIEQTKGYYGGAALPEPIELQCGIGEIELGDWSQLGVLNSYSGGAWYKKRFILAPQLTKAKVLVDLGSVVSTAEVHINGHFVATKVAPPWKIDVTEWIKPGENTLEVLVYNTLANHYTTIPTWYGGALEAGLLGPVRILQVSLA